MLARAVSTNAWPKSDLLRPKTLTGNATSESTYPGQSRRGDAQRLGKWKAILRRRGRKTGNADDKLKHFRDALSKVDDIDEDDLPRTPAALHQRLRILPSRQREMQKTNNAAKSDKYTFDVQSGGEAASSPLTETQDAGDGDAVKRNASYFPRTRARARVSARGSGGSGNGGDGASNAAAAATAAATAAAGATEARTAAAAAHRQAVTGHRLSKPRKSPPINRVAIEDAASGDRRAANGIRPSASAD